MLSFCSRFILVNAGITYLYFNSFQQIDEEEFGGAWELTKEGFMTSFAGFLVKIKTIIAISLSQQYIAIMPYVDTC